jgi:hypothetical protein
VKKILLPLFYFLLILVFFWQFFFKGLLPIPADTIVGMYHPFRDIYAKTNPNGIPFKNFLITDPVRQQYPWRSLAIDLEKKGELPVWNPYNFSGTPLLANLQSSAFYPLNFLFFVVPFEIAWSILIFLQPLLAGLFLYLYLNNLKLKKSASLIGAISFALSGFSIAWLEWGTILNTALWLPLTLLSIDKLLVLSKSGKIDRKGVIKWLLIFVFSLISSFFSGHLQIFFYLILLTLAYIFLKLIISSNRLRICMWLIIGFFIALAITVFQWLPAIKFISLSARNLDVVGWQAQGWFIPWQNLIQFLAPDFFGNPTTLNYYGIWNYAEFIGYIGIVPLTLALFALFFRKDKKTFFFGTVFFLSLIFALPTIFAKLPYKLEIPFISTSQPTRLLFITDFSLSILAALGLDYFIKGKNKKQILYILGVISIFFVALWSFVLFFHGTIMSTENLSVARHNLILPSALFATSLVLFLIVLFHKKERIRKLSFALLIVVTVFDLFRFGQKFETFARKEYLYPKTPVISFLQKQEGQYRVMSADSTIFPPNFSIIYKIQTLDGYDPLYIQRYGELMAALGRGKPDISPPFGFNRIITPQNPSSGIVDLLGVKYVLSLKKLDDTKLKEVFKDGKTIVYENTMVFPRAFFVTNTLLVNSKQEAISELFNINNPLKRVAVVENIKNKNIFKSNWDLGRVEFTTYQANKVFLETNSPGQGFLVLTDTYYPSWHAKIDGKDIEIFLTDYNFRGIIVPSGKHKVEFTNTLF